MKLTKTVIGKWFIVQYSNTLWCRIHQVFILFGHFEVILRIKTFNGETNNDNETDQNTNLGLCLIK